MLIIMSSLCLSGEPLNSWYLWGSWIESLPVQQLLRMLLRLLSKQVKQRWYQSSNQFKQRFVLNISNCSVWWFRNQILIWLCPGQIGSLQATQMSHEATIRNLDQEQSRLKEKIGRLEEEREALLNQSQAANEQHKQQVLKLEQVLWTLHVFQSCLRDKMKASQYCFLLSLSSVSAGRAPGLWERAVHAESTLWGRDASLQGGAGPSTGRNGGETPSHFWGGSAWERGGEETPIGGMCFFVSFATGRFWKSFWTVNIWSFPEGSQLLRSL